MSGDGRSNKNDFDDRAAPLVQVACPAESQTSPRLISSDLKTIGYSTMIS